MTDRRPPYDGERPEQLSVKNTMSAWLHLRSTSTRPLLRTAATARLPPPLESHATLPPSSTTSADASAAGNITQPASRQTPTRLPRHPGILRGQITCQCGFPLLPRNENVTRVEPKRTKTPPTAFVARAIKKLNVKRAWLITQPRRCQDKLSYINNIACSTMSDCQNSLLFVTQRRCRDCHSSLCLHIESAALARIVEQLDHLDAAGQDER
jgi:hypothetical protein